MKFKTLLIGSCLVAGALLTLLAETWLDPFPMKHNYLLDSFPASTTNNYIFRAGVTNVANGLTVRQDANSNLVVSVVGAGLNIGGDSWLPEGTLKTAGGRIVTRYAATTNRTLAAQWHYAVAKATLTFTLPAADSVEAGQLFIIKNKAGITTVRPTGADTIDDADAADVLMNKASQIYISDGVSNWEKN